MRARDWIWLAVGLAAVGTVIAWVGAPGSVLAVKFVDGTPAHKDYIIALVGLIVLAFAALGMDIRDWL